MNNDYTKRRFEDLYEQSYKNRHYTFTSFLNEAELSEFLEIKNSFAASAFSIYGGRENADRVMIRFGDPDDFGYEEDFPVKCIRIEPLSKKFSEKLSHRDFLGAILNLGIERDALGDIVIGDNEAFVFTTEKMAEFISNELIRVKHTAVSCCISGELPELSGENLEKGEVQAASERADGVIAKIFHLSRSDCSELFREKKIFINGRCTENSSYILREDDKVSVRGFGKFVFKGISGFTRKGNKIVSYEKYV